MKTDITILQQPNVPKALHKLAPRVIESAYWWKKQRGIMLEEQQLRCKACGTLVGSPSQLDLHEEYHVNYKEGYSDVKGMVGLCKDCHSFIHNGLLYTRAKKGEISFDKANFVFRRGFALLKDAGLEPNYAAAVHYLNLLEYFDKPVSEELRNRVAMLTFDRASINSEPDWTKWHLRWNGKKYYSLFKDMKDWRDNVATRTYKRK
jgi:hypothetical protein